MGFLGEVIGCLKSKVVLTVGSSFRLWRDRAKTGFVNGAPSPLCANRRRDDSLCRAHSIYHLPPPRQMPTCEYWSTSVAP
jgi:hypothetical protein